MQPQSTGLRVQRTCDNAPRTLNTFWQLCFTPIDAISVKALGYESVERRLMRRCSSPNEGGGATQRAGRVRASVSRVLGLPGDVERAPRWADDYYYFYFTFTITITIRTNSCIPVANQTPRRPALELSGSPPPGRRALFAARRGLCAGTRPRREEGLSATLDTQLVYNCFCLSKLKT